MPSTKEFESGLDTLFRQYTEGLRRDVGKQSRGRIVKFDRHKLRRRIERLVRIATEIGLKTNGKESFYNCFSEKRQWHPKRGKGWGLDAKKRSFRDWYDKNMYGRNCVYIFWAKRKCIYIGRTGAGGRRPQVHFEKYWFRSVTRIDTYIISGKRQLPMAECIATHLFNPKNNKIKSAQQKWRSNCQVCTMEVNVRKKLRNLFPLRRKK